MRLYAGVRGFGYGVLIGEAASKGMYLAVLAIVFIWLGNLWHLEAIEDRLSKQEAE